jgi:geranylgeranyl reductase family protein
MPDRFDLIVVGAGSGGSNAAAAAIERGLSVAQIDAQRFPRVKPCAGGVTIKAANALHGQLAGPVRTRFSAVDVSAWGGPATRFAHRSEMMRMVSRPEFDASLVRQNQAKSGFIFFDGEPVTDIRFTDATFLVTTSKRQLAARQLIGADGAYSVVNKRFEVSRPRAVATAVEINLPASPASPTSGAVPCLDFGVLPKGYGWVFPKDDHFSVGLYTFERGLKDIRRRLVDYARAKGLHVGPERSLHFEAHQLPVGGHRLRVPDVPVYLVGDAGGFADALTGEGIYHALESGRLAGRAAADVASGTARHTRYYEDLWSSVLSDTCISYHLAALFYRNPQRALRILELPFVWRPLMLGYAEGATVRTILTHGGRDFVRSLFRRLISRTTIPRSVNTDNRVRLGEPEGEKDAAPWP